MLAKVKDILLTSIFDVEAKCKKKLISVDANIQRLIVRYFK